VLLFTIFGTVFCAPFIRWVVIVPCYKLFEITKANQQKQEEEERAVDMMERKDLAEKKHKEVERLSKKAKKYAKVHAEVEKKARDEEAKQDLAHLPKKKKKKKEVRGNMNAENSYMAGLQKVAGKTTDKVHFNDGILNGAQNNAQAASKKIQMEIAERAARNKRGDFHQ